MSNGAESIIEVDAVTELIRGHELSAPGRTAKARLHWKKQGGKYVRERMDVEGEQIVGGRRYAHRTSVVITAIAWDPSRVR